MSSMIIITNSEEKCLKSKELSPRETDVVDEGLPDTPLNPTDPKGDEKCKKKKKRVHLEGSFDLATFSSEVDMYLKMQPHA